MLLMAGQFRAHLAPLTLKYQAHLAPLTPNSMIGSILVGMCARTFLVWILWQILVILWPQLETSFKLACNL
jgi:hypothetical protein